MNPNNPYNQRPQGYNPNSQPQTNYSSMAYLNSISAQQQPTSAPTPAAAPTESTHTFSIKRIVIFSVVSIIIVSTIAAVAIVASKDRNNLGGDQEKKNTGITAAEHHQEEKLNETLAELIKDDAHRDYESPNEYSPGYGAMPAEIIADYHIDITNPDFSNAASVPAMNSNILNYYLDQEGTIVVISDHYGISSMLGGKSNILIIYASEPAECDFIGFIPSDFNADGTNKDKDLFPEQTALHFSRSELFNQLSGSAEFYILRKEVTPPLAE